MIFLSREELTTVVELEEIMTDPYMVYDHFMHYTDEVFYVLDKNKMYGIITPGDLLRANQLEEVLYINQNYKYLECAEELDKARIIFEKFPTIHEIAVVEKGELKGVLKSEGRKTVNEWKGIRNTLNPWVREKRQWQEKEIEKLLQLECKFLVYPCLDLESCILSNEEQRLYNERKQLVLGGLLDAFSKHDWGTFFESKKTEYIETMIQGIKDRRLKYCNGIPMHYMSKSNPFFHISNGYRVTPNTPQEALGKIYMYGPCTIFGDVCGGL